VEAAAFLVILAFPTAHLFGLDVFLAKRRSGREGSESLAAKEA